MQERHFQLSYLEQLEAESIYVFREVAAVAERPVLLYSVGKDSSVLLHLARKAFAPGPLPFPLLHVDTGYKPEELIRFRNEQVARTGADLVVSRNEAAIAKGANPFDLGTQACCGFLKTRALLDGLANGNYDFAIGGARRDEEKSRAKERVFSLRTRDGVWDPKRQRPELWSLYNGRHLPGESVRVFPLSNWTEIDVWLYIQRESIPVCDLYFAEPREMIVRGEALQPPGPIVQPREGERVEVVESRYRSLGCYPCTGAVRSTATTVPEIVSELVEARTSERALRAIDHEVEAGMEKKKREGYF